MTLRDLIGAPSTELPRDTPNQHWVPREILAAEAAALQALNSNEEMSSSLREELDARGREYLRVSADRNRVESEIEARESEDRKRLVRELEEENRRKLRGKYE